MINSGIEIKKVEFNLGSLQRALHGIINIGLHKEYTDFAKTTMERLTARFRGRAVGNGLSINDRDAIQVSRISNPPVSDEWFEWKVMPANQLLFDVFRVNAIGYEKAKMLSFDDAPEWFNYVFGNQDEMPEMVRVRTKYEYRAGLNPPLGAPERNFFDDLFSITKNDFFVPNE